MRMDIWDLLRFSPISEKQKEIGDRLILASSPVSFSSSGIFVDPCYLVMVIQT